MRLSTATSTKPLTRRGLLSVISSIYDPLGLVAPFCLPPKLLVQDLCRRSFGWDQVIPPQDITKWNEWLVDLPGIAQLSVPRCTLPIDFGEPKSTELHIFCDASSVAYGAVCYVRYVGNDARVHCNFILGKSRLSPIKPVTIPRLELSSAVLATQLYSIIVKETDLSFDKTTFWSDSSIFLQSIQNSQRRFKVFVANRLKRVLDISSVDQWRHVDGVMNPADDATRGLKACALLSSTCRWLNAPEFLWQQEGDWPQRSFPPADLSSLELLSSDRGTISCVISEQDHFGNLISKFSNLLKLQKSVAWFVRFRDYLSGREDTKRGMLVSDEIATAMLIVIKFVQGLHFKDVFLRLRTSKSLPKALARLNPILQDGILRVGGRLQNSTLDFNAKHPIIIPKECHLTELIIRHAHATNGHVGPHHTWTIIREDYWIIDGGVGVRKCLGKCIACKRRNARPGTQVMADLPSCRVVSGHPPFYDTGVDMFGPILVRRARSHVKRFGCIFTCMTTRAVHLEIAESLSTSSFINCLRRFICRRGSPHTIYSDNGSNFLGARTALERSAKDWSENKWNWFLLANGITWRLNPPTASHMGGAWERLIRSVKSILFSMLNSQIVTEDVFHTFSLEVENILNSRPLTPISMDPRDDVPLTPNHLLRINGCTSVVPGVFVEADQYSHNRWRQIQYLAEQFWLKWRRRYLPMLQTRQKWTVSRRNLEVGDIVLVSDDRFPRRSWPLGRIVGTYPDNKGNIRQVDVKLKDAVLRRPITKLCLLKAVDVKDY